MCLSHLFSLLCSRVLPSLLLALNFALLTSPSSLRLCYPLIICTNATVYSASSSSSSSSRRPSTSHSTHRPGTGQQGAARTPVAFGDGLVAKGVTPSSARTFNPVQTPTTVAPPAPRGAESSSSESEAVVPPSREAESSSSSSSSSGAASSLHGVAATAAAPPTATAVGSTSTGSGTAPSKGTASKLQIV